LIGGSHDSGFLVMMQYSFVDGSQLIACSMYFVPFILCIILSSIYITLFQVASLHVFQPVFCTHLCTISNLHSGCLTGDSLVGFNTV